MNDKPDNDQPRGAWFRSTPTVVRNVDALIDLADGHGWEWQVVDRAVELRHPASGQLTRLSAHEIQQYPKRTLQSLETMMEVDEASVRRPPHAHVTSRSAMESRTEEWPITWRGVVVGAPACEYSPFSGSHISERSG